MSGRKISVEVHLPETEEGRLALACRLEEIHREAASWETAERGGEAEERPAET